MEAVAEQNSVVHREAYATAESDAKVRFPFRLLSRTFQAFRYRDFLVFGMWLGAFTSTTGTWTQTVANPGWYSILPAPPFIWD